MRAVQIWSLTLGIAIVLGSAGARAASLNMVYEKDPGPGGAMLFKSGDVGANLNVGDTLTFEVNAADGYAWQFGPATNFFSGQYLTAPSNLESFSTFDIDFFFNGTKVAERDDITQSTGGPGVLFFTTSPGGYTGNVDQVVWTALMTSINFPAVIRDEGFASTNAAYSQVSAVPLPAAAWLFASALLGMLGLKRPRASCSYGPVRA